tara:strand:- start:340 stop:531 length:192 start_codon:yes stop_codon:yes gene_type:complete
MKASITVEIKEKGLPNNLKKEALIDLLYNECYEWIKFDTPPKVQFSLDKSDESEDEDLKGLVD